MATSSPASLAQDFKDSPLNATTRQELRAAVSPEGDRIAQIASGGDTLHTGNIAAHEPGQQQLFHRVPPAGESKNESGKDAEAESESGGGMLHAKPAHYKLKPEDDPELQKEIQQIGGDAGQAKDIDGKPIRPADAARIQHLEEKADHPTGEGSLAARAQSAAAANVREGAVDSEAGLSAAPPKKN